MQPTVLELEDRQLLSSIIVNNPTDVPVGGQTDLRQAIVQANTAGGVQAIVFDSTVFSVNRTITLGGTQLELSHAERGGDDHRPGGGRDRRAAAG